jgi:hypothetical protein
MSDITISVIQPPSTTINVGVDETTLIQAGIGLPPHSVTHISGGSDELNHNLLGGLQGGASGQYYHLSSGQYFNLITGSGAFYPNSNPSGFITGVDLTPYATVTYVTGISGQLQAQITVLNNQTGAFYPRSNPSGYITGVNLSSYATQVYVTEVSGSLQDKISNLNNQTGAYVFKTETGNFITTSQTGQFYSFNNPSGYVATGYVTGVSGNLQTQITTLNNQTGSYYPRTNPSGYTATGYVTGISGALQTQITTLNNAMGSYVLNSQTGVFYPRTNPSGYITGVDLSFSGNYYTKNESESRYVNTTGAETILGDKTFHDKVYINNLYVTGLETIINTTNTNVASNYLLLNLTGGAVDGGIFFITGSGLSGINDSGAIIGFDHSDKFKFGIGTRASDLSTLNTIAAYEQVTGISGSLQTQISTLNNGTGNYALKSETGNFITNSQTGQFYANANPSGFITGINNLVFTTGDQTISGIKVFDTAPTFSNDEVKSIFMSNLGATDYISNSNLVLRSSFGYSEFSSVASYDGLNRANYNANYINLTIDGDPPDSYTYNFPQANGTLALDSTAVMLEGNQNIGGSKTFLQNIVGNGIDNRLPNQQLNSSDAILTLKVFEDKLDWNYLPFSSSQSLLSGSATNATAVGSISQNTASTAGTNYAFIRQSGPFNKSPLSWIGSTSIDTSQAIPFASKRTKIKVNVDPVTFSGDAFIWFGIWEKLDVPLTVLDNRGFGAKITSTSIRAEVHDGTTLTTGASSVYTDTGPFDLEVNYYQRFCTVSKNGTIVATVSGGYNINATASLIFYAYAVNGTTDTARVEYKNLRYKITDS